MTKLCFMIFAILGLAACSSYYSSNGEALYRKSVHGAKLATPAPLTNAQIGTVYDLPDQTQSPRVSIAPPVG